MSHRGVLRTIPSRHDPLAPGNGSLAGMFAKGPAGNAGPYRKAVTLHIKYSKTNTSLDTGLETSRGSLAATGTRRFVVLVHIAERLMSWWSMKLTQRHARGSGPQIGRPRASTVNSSRRGGGSNNETARKTLRIDVTKGDIRGSRYGKEHAACPHHTQLQSGTSRRAAESPNGLARPER
jgi:hypothetical protein